VPSDQNRQFYSRNRNPVDVIKTRYYCNRISVRHIQLSAIMDLGSLNKVRKPRPYKQADRAGATWHRHARRMGRMGGAGGGSEGCAQALRDELPVAYSREVRSAIKTAKSAQRSSEGRSKMQPKEQSVQNDDGPRQAFLKEVEAVRGSTDLGGFGARDLEEPVQEALRGLYGLCKGNVLKARCPTAVGMLHLVGDGELVKFLKAKQSAKFQSN
jgi:hypothetical protein